MRRRLIVVTGTGTEIGKTHVSVALVRRAARSEPALGFKPIESGASGARGADGEALLAASSATFHVKPPPAPYVLPRPVSPHLAARDVGITIDPARVVETVAPLCAAAPFCLVELAGGLFSPLSDEHTNAELIVRLQPTHVVLVAPNRLGVLHDVGAAVRAATASAIVFTAVALVDTPAADASSASNAAELRPRVPCPVAGIPRGTTDALSADPAVDALYALLA